MKTVELQRCARVALEKCGSVRAGERVLVVTDTMRDQSVAHSLIGAALAADAEGVLVVMPARRRTPQEPPASVLAAMQAADLIFLYTTYSLTHSSAQSAGAEGRRADHFDAGSHRRWILAHDVGRRGPTRRT